MSRLRAVVVALLAGALSAGYAARSSTPLPKVQYADPADEQLVDVPSTRPPAAPVAPAPVQAPPARATPPALAAPLTLEVLAVAVRPPSVAVGGEVQLVINYEVGGLAPGASLTLTEERQLVYGNTVITTLSDNVTRTAGPYTASKTVSVPADANQGLYRLRARVYVGGVSSGSTAVFEVR